MITYLIVMLACFLSYRIGYDWGSQDKELELLQNALLHLDEEACNVREAEEG